MVTRKGNMVKRKQLEREIDELKTVLRGFGLVYLQEIENDS